MVREEGDRTQRSVLMVLRMAGSVPEVRQDAHGLEGWMASAGAG